MIGIILRVKILKLNKLYFDILFYESLETKILLSHNEIVWSVWLTHSFVGSC